MPVPIVWHPACLLHDPGPGHPERPGRLEAVLAALREPEMGGVVEWHEARPATRAQLERVHPASYLDGLARLPEAWLRCFSGAFTLDVQIAQGGFVDRTVLFKRSD